MTWKHDVEDEGLVYALRVRVPWRIEMGRLTELLLAALRLLGAGVLIALALALAAGTLALLEGLLPTPIR